MEMQAEAERKKRAQVLESEGNGCCFLLSLLVSLNVVICCGLRKLNF